MEPQRNVMSPAAVAVSPHSIQIETSQARVEVHVKNFTPRASRPIAGSMHEADANPLASCQEPNFLCRGPVASRVPGLERGQILRFPHES